MKIFVSYDSNHEALAEPIVLALRNRGYSVFFSHDDLPPAASFEKRVEDAIGQSDLLIFLISPQSVTRGRFTLTELAFARTKWPKADRRVLPVMLVDTPLADVPNYLKSVTILTPEGNAAAEVGSAVEKLAPTSSPSSMLGPVAICLALGAISGVMSSQFITDPWRKLTVLDIPLLPGFYFGLALLAIVRRWGTRNWFELMVMAACVVLAWFVACKTTITAHDFLTKFVAPGAAEEERRNLPYIMAIVGLIGGFIGSAGTIVGVSIAAAKIRRLDTWVITILIGTLGGVLLEIGDKDFVVLFTVWQAAIAASIGYGLMKPASGPS